MSATGFGLTIGKFTSQLPGNRTPSGGDWNLLLVVAIAAIVAGLIIAFLRRDKTSAALSFGTSATALLFLWLGTSRYTKSALLEQAAKSRGTSEIEQAAAAMINVHWHYGFWLAVAALVIAGAMAALVYSGRDADFAGPASRPAS
ncbi:hypothetical protein [Sphingomonas sp. S2-65]|uniref:hypothetical protein n=1 Tax=Sphingomonas sp. S2-65 TaxID=2903960 RepID=UPI001F1CDE1B|nr:hypothetical protein [Sphingomonas sp. S2-65]UYY58720.1 hypothetical protein LZ586_00995 [Sphingomonas sp. S2-65]